jgi:diguanylate cyclase (GGDEF)-like protein
MKKFQIRLVGVLVILVAVVFISISFKYKLDTFNKDNILLTKKVYQLEYNAHTRVDLITDSIINKYYNSDPIVEHIKYTRVLFDEFLSFENSIQKDYPKTYSIIKEYIKDYPKIDTLTYKFMQSNAKVKNSYTFLENNLTNLNSFDKEYRANLIEVIKSFTQLKNSFDSASNISKELYEYFKNHSQDNNKEHMLVFRHIDILYSEVDNLKAIYNHIHDSSLIKNNPQIISTLENESYNLKESIESRFLIILLAYALSVVMIMVLILQNKRDSDKIISLQVQKERDSQVDSLTAIGNRTMYYNIIKDKKDIAILLVDIVDFKNINSIVGYDGGDYILKSIANILKQNHQDVYRVGSDHFAVIVDTNCNLKLTADRILVSIDDFVFKYQELELPVVVNIGISTQSPYIKSAEIAIDRNRNTHKRVSTYESHMDDTAYAKDNIQMLSKVKDALANDNIRPFFQPIVDVKTKEIVKYEALVRLIDNGKPVVPIYFLDIAQKSKLYTEITKNVFVKSIAMIKKSNTPVSINLSYTDIADDYMIRFINILLQSNKDIAHMVTFELLESEEIGSYDRLIYFIRLIKSYGAKLAIDDFGSGYSNYTQLFRLEPDIVKIDGSLIKDIDTNQNSLNIVESILSLTKKSNIKVVAEFVDKEQIHIILQRLGVEYAQGYYYSAPQDLLTS